MKVLENGDTEEIHGPSFRNLKMDEVKEGMLYDTLGVIQNPESTNKEGLYDITSNSSVDEQNNVSDSD